MSLLSAEPQTKHVQHTIFANLPILDANNFADLWPTLAAINHKVQMGPSESGAPVLTFSVLQVTKALLIHHYI